MALTKQFIEMQEAYESKIADLEAKLAESEEAVVSILENTQLKQQLAEKKKEIEEHKAKTTVFAPKISNNADLILQIIESDRVGIDFLKQSQNQTAIAELEKVKDFIIKNNEPTRKMADITRFINQQINNLRGK